MPDQWLVKRPQAAGAPVPPPAVNLPNAILGTPVLTTSYGTDQNHQLLIDVTIPISWPGGAWGDVDRLIVHLLAPDNVVDTQEGFVGGPGTGGTTAGQEVPGIVIGDQANASKIVTLDSTEILIEQEWDAKRPYVHFTHPAPTSAEWWRAIVVSGAKTATNKVETSPSVRIYVTPEGPDVLGLEYAPLALNFHLINPQTQAVTDQPYYDTAEGGAPQWGFSATWENDVKDPRFPKLGGYDVVIEYPDGSRETHAGKSSNDLRHDSPMWPIGAPGDFTVWLVSWSSQAGNKRNSIVAGLTPSKSFHVAAPVGPSGNEFAANVTGFQLVNPYYGKNGSGQKTLYLPFVWTKPADDRAYGGGIIVMIRADNVHYPLTGLETDDNQVCELMQFPVTGASENVTFYFKSVSTSGKVNEYQAGTTPSISFTLYGPPETTPAVSATDATIFYEKDEFGNNKYGYSGSWANPVKSLYPEYQGVKVYLADATATEASRVQLTGVETGTSFKTSTWTTPAAVTSVWLYFVSVDVNGVERNFASSPKKQLFISPQGGTISNDALPDIDVANFAAGIEPVTIGNYGLSDPVTGYLPASVTKMTTTIFNETDQRLYRWYDGASKYKVVGSAPDIDAATVTAGKMAVGAIGTRELAANEILVGPQPTGLPATDRPPIFKVMKADNTSMVGFFGTYQSWEGIYALNLKVGPTYISPILECNNLGVTIKGDANNNDTKNVIFHFIAANGSFVKMSPLQLAPGYVSCAIEASSATGDMRAYHISRGMVLYEGERQIGALARNPSYAAGELVLYGTTLGGPIRVLCSGVDGGTDIGFVRADSFRCGGWNGVGTAAANYTVSYMKPGGATGTMYFAGGLLVSQT